MTILPQVIEARYVSDYCIELLFNTGLRKTVNFALWIKGPVFEPFRDRTEFRKFFVAGGTVCWPNGADIAPETLFSIRGVSERAAGRRLAGKLVLYLSLPYFAPAFERMFIEGFTVMLRFAAALR